MLTDEEKMVLAFMGYGGPKPGNFYTLLIDTIAHADMTNTFKLSLGFPELVKAVNDYRYGILIDRYEAEQLGDDAETSEVQSTKMGDALLKEVHEKLPHGVADLDVEVKEICSACGNENGLHELDCRIAHNLLDEEGEA